MAIIRHHGRLRQALPELGVGDLHGAGWGVNMRIEVSAARPPLHGKLRICEGSLLPFLQDQVPLAKPISTIYTCPRSQLSGEACSLGTPLFITSQLFPWKHKQRRATLFPSPRTTTRVRWTSEELRAGRRGAPRRGGVRREGTGGSLGCWGCGARGWGGGERGRRDAWTQPHC